MKARYTGQTSPLELTHGKVYDVIAVEKKWLRIVDDSGDYPDAQPQGYLYPPDLFEIIEN